MLSESKGDYLPERIPDTLQALIAARIDGLPSAEKALLHRAAVIGRIFWHGAITHVAPDLDVDGADRRSPAARLPARRAAVDDHRRARVPLQAHADPRGRLRRAVQGRPRRAAQALRRVAEGADRRRAPRDPRVPPRPRGSAPRRARRGASGRARRRGRRRARGGWTPRARARVEPLGPQAPAPRRRAGADARAPLPGRPRRVADDRAADRLRRDGQGRWRRPEPREIARPRARRSRRSPRSRCCATATPPGRPS